MQQIWCIQIMNFTAIRRTNSEVYVMQNKEEKMIDLYRTESFIFIIFFLALDVAKFTMSWYELFWCEIAKISIPFWFLLFKHGVIDYKNAWFWRIVFLAKEKSQEKSSEPKHEDNSESGSEDEHPGHSRQTVFFTYYSVLYLNKNIIQTREGRVHSPSL